MSLMGFVYKQMLKTIFMATHLVHQYLGVHVWIILNKLGDLMSQLRHF